MKTNYLSRSAFIRKFYSNSVLLVIGAIVSTAVLAAYCYALFSGMLSDVSGKSIVTVPIIFSSYVVATVGRLIYKGMIIRKADRIGKIEKIIFDFNNPSTVHVGRTSKFHALGYEYVFILSKGLVLAYDNIDSVSIMRNYRPGDNSDPRRHTVTVSVIYSGKSYQLFSENEFSGDGDFNAAIARIREVRPDMLFVG